MSRPVSDYRIVGVRGSVVFVRDLDLGGRSVTNDAEAVVAEILEHYPMARIVYRDSSGHWDEMTNDGESFTGFQPWIGQLPEVTS